MVGRRLFTLATWIAVFLGTGVGALAQGIQRPPGTIPNAPQGAQQQICLRLESQLAAIDRGPNDPMRMAQVNRYEETIRRQQGELDRAIVRSRRLGCENTGFFSLFTQQPAECGPLLKQIRDLHAANERAMMELQRVQGGTADRESQRRAVLVALAENDCGPQYRSAAVNRSRGLFDTLFGPGSTAVPGTAPDVPQSSTFRTLCVRTCDGYYWPISFSTVPGRFSEDERVCQRMCPAAQVVLFSHRNPGEDVAQAVSASGQVYGDMPNAFLYRKQFTSACSCRRAGETWANALQNLDETVERGDIVVTEERAKQLSRPREQRPSKPPPRSSRGAPQAPQAGASGAGPRLRGNVSGDPGAADNRPVRSVGPTFLPREASPRVAQ
jgi:hypothetical protein